MATTKANLQRYKGGRDVFGGHGWFGFRYVGPASYSGGAGNGDEVDDISIANQCPLRGIDMIDGGVTVSGTFSVIAGALVDNNGIGAPSKWVFRWIVISTGVEVANAVNLSTEVCIVNILGG
jgi:hypothetical protein